MIIYVDVKSGKVDLTKAELEKLLKEKYDEGYKDGKKFLGSVTYSCPYGYGSCPYYYKWPYYSPITWTSTSTSTEGTITCGDSITSTITTTTDNPPMTVKIPEDYYKNNKTEVYLNSITFKEK